MPHVLEDRKVGLTLEVVKDWKDKRDAFYLPTAGIKSSICEKKKWC
jgi:hypothetical protein